MLLPTWLGSVTRYLYQRLATRSRVAGPAQRDRRERSELADRAPQAALPADLSDSHIAEYWSVPLGHRFIGKKTQ